MISFPDCAASVDLVLILDSSTSVSKANFKKMLEFTKYLIEEANIDDGSVRVGVISYSTLVHVQFQLNTYNSKADVFAAIDRIPYTYGSTNSADGLRIMRTKMFSVSNGDRKDVANIAMIITDGVSNINSRRTIPEAREAHRAGIHVYAIGIGLRDTRELDAMASPPAEDNSFKVKEFSELSGLKPKLFTSVCEGKLF